MSKWTKEKLVTIEDKISIVVNEHGKTFLFKCISELTDAIHVVDRLGFNKGLEISKIDDVYDFDMNLIDPPKQDERVAMYESVGATNENVVCNANGVRWNFYGKKWLESQHDDIRKANRKKEPCGYLNVTKNVMEWE